MKINKKTIFSIILVLLFIGSLFAVIAYGTTEDNNEADYEPTEVTEPEAEFVSYSANIDANVQEIFPQLIVAGLPIEFEETEINNRLLNIQGIKNKQIEFRTDNDGNINLMITLSYVPEKKEEVVNGIKDQNIFAGYEIYQLGLLSIPEKVKFSNDKNQEIEYEFINTTIEGVLGMNTIKGDSLSVIIYSTFRGTELINARGIENINNSSQFQMVMDYGEFKVVGFKDKIYTKKVIALTEGVDINALESQIKQVYENTSFEYNTEPLTIEVPADRNQDELNEKLNRLKEDGLFSEYFFDQNKISVNFDNNVTKESYTLAKARILEDINCLEDCVSKDAEIVMGLELNYQEVDMEKIAGILGQGLKFSILAEVDTSNIAISGKKYNYEKQTTEVLLDYPDDLNKTTVGLNIQGYCQRDELLYLGLNK